MNVSVRAPQIFARIGGDDRLSVVELEEVLVHLVEAEATLEPVAP